MKSNNYTSSQLRHLLLTNKKYYLRHYAIRKSYKNNLVLEKTKLILNYLTAMHYIKFDYTVTPDHVEVMHN